MPTYTYTTLNDPAAGGNTTVASGINSVDRIFGNYRDNSGAHGFLYYNGTYTTLDVPLPAGSALGLFTAPASINDAGQMVGYYLDGNNFAHGFLYYNGTFTTLDNHANGGYATYLSGINNAGQIVGYYQDDSPMGH
jgi:probable HAF family extracellular repeat protein